MDDQRLDEIARGYGDLLSAECDLSEHVDRFTDQFRLAMREALASQAGVCDECGNPLVPSEATWYHRACDEKRDDAKEEELRSLREERDLERSRFASWAETFEALVVEIGRQPGEWGHLRHSIQGSLTTAVAQFKLYAAGQPSPTRYRKRAESAEAELQRLREGMRYLRDQMAATIRIGGSVSHPIWTDGVTKYLDALVSPVAPKDA